MNWKILLGLSCFTLVYVILGGVIFHFIESPQEEATKVDSRSLRNQFLSNFTCINAKQFDMLLSRVIQAYDNGVTMTNETTPNNWDVASSVFFSTTVITTIGYGNISPSTFGGKVFCIFFALIGIPITAVMLSGIGQNLWDAMERFNKYQCCQGKQKMWKRIRNASFLLGGIVFLMIVPASIFMAVEGWDWGSAFYYTFITLTTIGFGDFVAGASDSAGSSRAVYRLLVGVWIVFGLAWLSTLISLAQDAVSERVDKSDDETEMKNEEKPKENGSANGDIESRKDHGEDKAGSDRTDRPESAKSSSSKVSPL